MERHGTQHLSLQSDDMPVHKCMNKARMIWIMPYFIEFCSNSNGKTGLYWTKSSQTSLLLHSTSILCIPQTKDRFTCLSNYSFEMKCCIAVGIFSFKSIYNKLCKTIKRLYHRARIIEYIKPLQHRIIMLYGIERLY